MPSTWLSRSQGLFDGIFFYRAGTYARSSIANPKKRHASPPDIGGSPNALCRAYPFALTLGVKEAREPGKLKPVCPPKKTSGAAAPLGEAGTPGGFA